MPHSVPYAVPNGVMPRFLSSAFTSVDTYEARINEYPDGTSQRDTETDNFQRRWRLRANLPPAVAAAVRSFLAARWNEAFWFYDAQSYVAEGGIGELETTDPIGNFDETGEDVVGRWLVRLEGGWSQSKPVGIGEAPIELVEVKQAFTGGDGPLFDNVNSSGHLLPLTLA